MKRSTGTKNIDPNTLNSTEIRFTTPRSIATRAVMAKLLGAVQTEIMTGLATATPTAPGGDVYDLRPLAKTLRSHRRQPAVSRAVRGLVRTGILEWLMPTDGNLVDFRADSGLQGQVRYLRRGAES